MALHIADFQSLIDWCRQGQVGIFLSDVQAFLTEQGQDKGSDTFYRVFFSGTLSYSPPNSLRLKAAIIEGTLWTPPWYGPFDATIIIDLNDPVGIGLRQRGGPGLNTDDLNLGGSIPPNDMKVLFRDTQNLIEYSLDLGKHRSINWRSFVARPGVDYRTGLQKGEPVPKVGG